MTIENGTCLFIENTLEEFVAVAIGFGMINKNLVVDVLYGVIDPRVRYR
mgnify:CR=1 FL=1